jgi:hypothetical protein
MPSAPSGSPAQSVALIVKRRSDAAGLGPEQLSGHSLRAGICDGGRGRRRRGAQDRQRLSAQGPPVLRRYIHAATAFDDVGEVL